MIWPMLMSHHATLRLVRGVNATPHATHTHTHRRVELVELQTTYLQLTTRLWKRRRRKRMSAGRKQKKVMSNGKKDRSRWKCDRPRGTILIDRLRQWEEWGSLQLFMAAKAWWRFIRGKKCPTEISRFCTTVSSSEHNRKLCWCQMSVEEITTHDPSFENGRASLCA